jgi:DNA-directed RNA polymerase subunit M/transcription elongation factor TFIIS
MSYDEYKMVSDNFLILIEDAYNDTNSKLKEENTPRFRIKPLVTKNKIFCRCGSSSILFTTRQTRSADEGSTQFCCCKKCGNSWVVS